MVNNHSCNLFIDGITLLNGDLLTGVINQLLSGMILQVWNKVKSFGAMDHYWDLTPVVGSSKVHPSSCRWSRSFSLRSKTELGPLARTSSGIVSGLKQNRTFVVLPSNDPRRVWSLNTNRHDPNLWSQTSKAAAHHGTCDCRGRWIRWGKSRALLLRPPLGLAAKVQKWARTRRELLPVDEEIVEHEGLRCSLQQMMHFPKCLQSACSGPCSSWWAPWSGTVGGGTQLRWCWVWRCMSSVLSTTTDLPSSEVIIDAGWHLSQCWKGACWSGRLVCCLETADFRSDGVDVDNSYHFVYSHY